ncbi:MAG: alternative ribosome rescue aminoacyl-tRNA hydrolase ArfB [Planctomycetota bacterium]
MPGRLRLGPDASVDPADLHIEFVASSGPGGQNVNKRATKARLRVAVDALDLPPGARSRLRRLAGSLLTEGDELVIAADEHRSQGRNRAAAVERLRDLARRACVRPKPRKPTKPSRGSIERRLRAKRVRGDIKRSRRTGGRDD